MMRVSYSNAAREILRAPARLCSCVMQRTRKPAGPRYASIARQIWDSSRRAPRGRSNVQTSEVGNEDGS